MKPNFIRTVLKPTGYALVNVANITHIQMDRDPDPAEMARHEDEARYVVNVLTAADKRIQKLQLFSGLKESCAEYMAWLEDKVVSVQEYPREAHLMSLKNVTENTLRAVKTLQKQDADGVTLNAVRAEVERQTSDDPGIPYVTTALDWLKHYSWIEQIERDEQPDLYRLMPDPEITEETLVPVCDDIMMALKSLRKRYVADMTLDRIAPAMTAPRIRAEIERLTGAVPTEEETDAALTWLAERSYVAKTAHNGEHRFQLLPPLLPPAK